MELLPLVCIYILTWSARGDQTDPPVYKIVMEGDGVVLPCSFGAMDITNKAFDWKKQNVAHDKKEVFYYESGTMYGSPLTGQAEQFKGRVFHFPDQLTSGNASIQIKPTKVDNSGTYICINATTPPTILSRVHLTVGAAKKPYVTILEQTKDSALLECEVHGASPKPNVTWQDSAGNILPAEEPQITERENRYDIILQTTVTKTDRYHCVATQEEINQQMNRTIYVRMEDGDLKDRKGENTSDPTALAVVAALLGLLSVVVVVLLVLVCTGLITPKCKGSQATTDPAELVQRPDQDPYEPLNA